MSVIKWPSRPRTVSQIEDEALKQQKHEEWLAFMQGVNKLYEHKFGHPPEDSDQAKAAHFVKWRFGGQILIDAVARIRELETD